jgi:ankyrin repeat protein
MAGRTPLSHAAQRGHTGICRFLLEHSAVVDSRSDKANRTPLYYAARNGHLETVQLLLIHGADIESSEYEGYTALSWAQML